MNRINKKWQAIILVTLIISFLSVGFSSYIIYDKRANVDKLMDIQKRNIHAVIITIEKFNTDRYQERIISLLDIKASPAREKMLLAFKQQNREDLIKLSIAIDNKKVSEVFTDIDLKIQSMALVHQNL